MSDPKSHALAPTVAVSRALLATAPGRRKLDVVFDQADPQLFVRRLPAEDVYFAIKEIGLTDAADLIGFAAPSQFRAFVDLDAWDRDVPDPLRVILWLRLALEGSKSVESFRAKRKALDSEMIMHVLKTQTVMHEIVEGDSATLDSDNYIRTAEGKFFVEIIPDGEDGVTVRQLLEDFIREDPFLATRAFDNARWEIASELEESALRWRTGRMRDMGFPEFEEAVRIWTPAPANWKPSSAVAAAGPVSGVPALLLTTGGARLFLDHVASLLPDESRPAFNEGLVYLLNCAIVADGIDPKDLDLARESLAATRDLLSLGLEIASDGQEDVALGILSTTPAGELFRFSVAKLLELSREAEVAGRAVSFGAAGAATVLDSPDAEILSGLRRKRPRLYDPPRAGEKKPRGGLDWRALRDRTDLATARRAIARAKLTKVLLEQLAIDGAALEKIADGSGRAITAVTLSQLLLTTALRPLVGVSEGTQAIARDRIPGLCALFEAGKLTPATHGKLAAFFGRLAQGLSPDETAVLRELVPEWLEKLESELGAPCAAGGLDARFVECVLVGGAV